MEFVLEFLFPLYLITLCNEMTQLILLMLLYLPEIVVE